MKIDSQVSSWCVYMHKNKINNKIYVGITSRKPEDRWGNNGSHYTKEKQPVFYNAIKKYGWDNFEHIIVENNLTEEAAKQTEISLIALYKSNCKKYKNPSHGYNMTDGGDGTLGRACTEITKIKISNAKKGRALSREQKEKLSLIFSDNGNPFYGKTRSEETKKLLSEIRSMPVVQLSLAGEYVEEFASGKNASVVTGIDESAINGCCSGRAHNKSAGGFLWLYKKDYEENIDVSYNNNHFRPVVQLDMNMNFISKYDTIKEASDNTGVRATGIISCCRGTYNTSGGYKWMYKSDYDKLVEQQFEREVNNIAI